jgi:apolipoprotein D and lipocalin family protein
MKQPRKIARNMAILIAFVLLATACAMVPNGILPVNGFDVNRYLGVWYEIARLDHSFERGMTRVQAEYVLRKDGGIDVINSGFDPEKKVWKKAIGKGYFVGSQDVGQLKVSFFGPFYGAYNVIDIDRNYTYAIACGNTRNYLWILARTPNLEEPVRAAVIEKAKNLGFETDKLIIVQH